MAVCVSVHHRGKAFLGGISIATFAQDHAHHLAATDKILARYVEDLGGLIQLTVAGCLRTLDETTTVQLCSSPLGRKALRDALRGKCEVVVSLPQVQHHVNLMFAGRDEVDDHAFDIDDLKSKQAWR
eukprot:7376225-Prymnesium_polylepis.1